MLSLIKATVATFMLNGTLFSLIQGPKGKTLSFIGTS